MICAKLFLHFQCNPKITYHFKVVEAVKKEFPMQEGMERAVHEFNITAVIISEYMRCSTSISYLLIFLPV